MLDPNQDSSPAPRSLRSSRLVAIDAVLAAAYTIVLGAVGFCLAAPHDNQLWAVSLAVAGIGPPLAFRRRWPRPVFGVVSVATVASLLFGLVPAPYLAAAFALYPVALTEPARRWVPTRVIATLSVGGAVLLPISGPADWSPPGLGLLPAGATALGIAWTAGRVVRERRRYLARYAAQRARRAVADERLRIARELHDVVAHSMGVIAVKAGVANHLVRARAPEDEDTSGAVEALAHIESASKSALAEMRRMLGVLRSDPDDLNGGQGGAILGLPRLADLSELVSRAELADVWVELDAPTTTAIPEDVQATVYRIVQEAITNVIKHAAPARCAVRIDTTESAVRAEIIDNGRGAAASRGEKTDPEGKGILGMRERVLAYGGTLVAGPRPHGGFGVYAHIPYEHAPTTSEEHG